MEYFLHLYCKLNFKLVHRFWRKNQLGCAWRTKKKQYSIHAISHKNEAVSPMFILSKSIYNWKVNHTEEQSFPLHLQLHMRLLSKDLYTLTCEAPRENVCGCSWQTNYEWIVRCVPSQKQWASGQSQKEKE